MAEQTAQSNSAALSVDPSVLESTSHDPSPQDLIPEMKGPGEKREAEDTDLNSQPAKRPRPDPEAKSQAVEKVEILPQEAPNVTPSVTPSVTPIATAGPEMPPSVGAGSMTGPLPQPSSVGMEVKETRPSNGIGTTMMGATTMGTAPMGTAPMGTAPMGTAPMGTAPMGTTGTGTTTNLYICHIPEDYQDGNLQALFAPFGSISRVQILKTPDGKSRGVGFVHYDQAESAAAAIAALNNKAAPGPQSGLPLRVEYAKKKGEMKSRTPYQSRTIQHPYASLAMPRTPMRTPTPSNPYGAYGAAPSSFQPSPGSEKLMQKNVYVAQLPPEMTKEQLQALFQTFGQILECNILKDNATGLGRGVGFVHFASRESASMAINQMNNYQIPGHQKPLRVKFARDTKGTREKGSFSSPTWTHYQTPYQTQGGYTSYNSYANYGGYPGTQTATPGYPQTPYQVYQQPTTQTNAYTSYPAKQAATPSTSYPTSTSYPGYPQTQPGYPPATTYPQPQPQTTTQPQSQPQATAQPTTASYPPTTTGSYPPQATPTTAYATQPQTQTPASYPPASTAYPGTTYQPPQQPATTYPPAQYR